MAFRLEFNQVIWEALEAIPREGRSGAEPLRNGWATARGMVYAAGIGCKDKSWQRGMVAAHSQVLYAAVQSVQLRTSEYIADPVVLQATC
jgi:hypothetical protein